MHDFLIFCAGCGGPTSYQKAWKGGLVKALVCGKECFDKIQDAYCRMLIGDRLKPKEEVNGNV